MRVGTFVRRFDDGYEKVIFEQSPEGRAEQVGYEGLVIPHRTLAPFLTAVLKKGLDRGSARMDRRREMEQHGE